MRVTEIEMHEVTLDYDERRVHELSHYYFSKQRTIYVAHTDNGLVGLGEGGSPASPSPPPLGHFGLGPTWDQAHLGPQVNTLKRPLMGCD